MPNIRHWSIERTPHATDAKIVFQSRAHLLLYRPLVAIFAVATAVVVTFDAEFFSVHASIAQPLAIDMGRRWRARFAKLDAIVFAFSKWVFHFAGAQEIAAIRLAASPPNVRTAGVLKVRLHTFN